jgi:exopolysaccharide production protein ExoZ
VLLLLLMLVARFAPKSVFSSFYSNDIMLEFVAGILSFHIYSWAKPAVCKGMRPLFYLVSVISICGLVWYEGVRFYNPGGNRLWFGVIAYLLLQSVVLLSRSGWEINNPLLVLIGDSSYTLYLLHPLVISTMHHAIARAVPILQIQRPFGALAAVLVSVFCAVPVYVYIERPVHRRLNNLLPSAKCGHSGHLNLSMPLRSN